MYHPKDKFDAVRRNPYFTLTVPITTEVNLFFVYFSSSVVSTYRATIFKEPAFLSPFLNQVYSRFNADETKDLLKLSKGGDHCAVMDEVCHTDAYT